MMRKLGFGVLLLAIAAGCAAQSAHADADDRRFYLAPMASFTLGDHERGSRFGYGGELALGKRVTKGLELELLGSFTNFDIKQSDFPASAGKQPSNARLYGGGGGLNVYLAPSHEGWLSGLFLHADVQRGQGSKAPGPIRSYGTTLFDAGLGYNYQLTSSGFFQGMALRAEALYQQDAHGHGELGTAYGNQHKYFQEAVFNLGLRIPFGGHAVVEAPAEPAAEVVAPVDDAPAPPEETPPAPPPCETPAPGQPISLEGCKLGDTIVLRGVNFDFNKDTLTPNAKTILDGVADALKARTDIKVEVAGHTDGKGSAPYNQKLSERRAAVVKRYLVSRGIAADRMSSKGYGKTMPVADNNTDEGREINRRVELKVTDAAADKAPVETDSVPTSGAMDNTTPAEAAPAADSGSSSSSSDSGSSTAPAADAPADTPSTPTDAPAPSDASTPPP